MATRAHLTYAAEPKPSVLAIEYQELIAQAAVFHVRHTFLLKLGDILPAQRLLPRWNILPVLAALDPDTENVQLVRCLISLKRRL